MVFVLGEAQVAGVMPFPVEIFIMSISITISKILLLLSVFQSET